MGDEIEIKTLGKNELGPKASNWLYNIATNYDVGSVSLVDPQTLLIKLKLKMIISSILEIQLYLYFLMKVLLIQM